MGVTAAGIAAGAAAVSAAAAVGTTAYQMSQGGGGGIPGMGGSPIRLPTGSPGAVALQKQMARFLGQNAYQTPPTFGEFVSSGGQAKFPIIQPGMTPKEAVQYGLTSKGGQAIPWFDPAKQNELTAAQRIFIGKERLRERSRQGTDLGNLTPEEIAAQQSLGMPGKKNKGKK